MKRSTMHIRKTDFAAISHRRFFATVLWTLLLCLLIVIGAAAVARAARNFRIALTEKPDIAIYLLLPEEGIGRTTLLRENEGERDYLAETKDGPKLVRLKKGGSAWYAALVEPLHE